MVKQKSFVIYLVKFLGSFCLVFYGTEAIIALSSPEGRYSPFVADRLNFIDPFRHFLLSSASAISSLYKYQTFFPDPFTLQVVGGKGVRMVYSCIGYGVLSFWMAFVFANSGTWKKKFFWIAGGCAALIFINICRIGLLLVATNRGWPIPLGLDHHTWFNIVAYVLIFTMIYFYDRSGRKVPEASPIRYREESLQPSTTKEHY